MICPNCKTEFTGAFCPGCGARAEESLKKQNIRIRKEYKTVVYLCLLWFVDVLFLGIADFYAGYIKMGLFKTVLSIIGFVLAIALQQFGFFALPAISLLISFFEMTRAPSKMYMLENGSGIVLVHQLDLIYDRPGTDNLLRSQYGCTVSCRSRLG